MSVLFSSERHRPGGERGISARRSPFLDPFPYAWGVSVRRIFKWLVGIVIVSVLVVAAGAISGFAAPLPTATLTVATAPAPTGETAMTLPASGASAIGFADSDTLISGVDPTTQRAIGSIAKIVTALVVLDAKPITDITQTPTLTMTQTDVQFYNSYDAQGGSVTEVLQGLQLNEYQVLQLMLLPSANNYAATAANWAYGSVDNFKSAAVTWLTKHGIRSTVITDPAGLDAGTVSTPSDLVALGRLAMENSTIAKIVAQKSASIPTIGTVSNTNLALGANGVIGIKTGTTLSAGHSLLFAVDAGAGAPGSPVIGVILGQQTRDDLYAAVTTLTAQIVAAYHSVTVVAAGTVAATLSAPWGASADLTFTHDVTVDAVGATTVTIAATHPEVSTVAKGSTDGVATVTVTDLRGQQTFTVPLAAQQSISTAPLSWQLDHALRWLPADVLPFIGWR